MAPSKDLTITAMIAVVTPHLAHYNVMLPRDGI
jgi:hypothetical protein